MGAETAVESLATRGASLRRELWLRRAAAALAVVAIAEIIGSFLLSAGGGPFPLGLTLLEIGVAGCAILFPLGRSLDRPAPADDEGRLADLDPVRLGPRVREIVTYGYGATRMLAAPSRPFALEALVGSPLFFIPAVAAGTVFILLLFPTDRLLGPRWRIVVVMTVVGSVLYEIGAFFQPGEINSVNLPGLLNPFGASAAWAQTVDRALTLGNALIAISVLLGVVSLVVRYRRADSVEAAQIRWIAFVGVLAGIDYPIAALQIGPVSDLAFELGIVILALMLIAIGIAITRYHLYDIDRLINRTLVYGSLTAILAGVFTAAVGLAQRLFVTVTGEKSDAAIVLTTLVVATLYAPLRKRIEAVVDRQFKYDQRRFGAYRSELRQLLSLVEPPTGETDWSPRRSARWGRLGAAIVDADDRPTAMAGEGPCRPRCGSPLVAHTAPWERCSWVLAATDVPMTRSRSWSSRTSRALSSPPSIRATRARRRRPSDVRPGRPCHLTLAAPSLACFRGPASPRRRRRPQCREH